MSLAGLNCNLTPVIDLVARSGNGDPKGYSCTLKGQNVFPKGIDLVSSWLSIFPL